MAKDGHWIEGLNKGYLHRATHTPPGRVIPQGRIHKAEHAENPHLAKAARAAETLEHMHKKFGGKV